MKAKEEPILLSIVIPAFNEEERILTTLRKIKAYLKEKTYPCQIIVVDDGSRDKTPSLVLGLSKEFKNLTLLKNERNTGKGYSVKRGVMAAQGEYILFSDADLSAPIQEIEKFFPYFEQGFDVVIGSRALKDSDIKLRQPWWREGMGKTFNLFVQAIVFGGIKDTQCGFKCFKREVAHHLFSLARIEGFSFDVEVLFLAKKFGYNIKEVPVVWINSAASKVHPLLDSARMFLELLKIRFTTCRHSGC